MKQILLTCSLLFTCFAFGQTSVNEIARSKIYVMGTYFDKKNEVIRLQTRTDLTDTIIGNLKYRKFQTEEFTDYSDKRTANIYYETFAADIYSLLDKKLNAVHKINYQASGEQVGIFFGKPTRILPELIDTQSSYPTDSLIPTEKIQRKYYQKDNPEIYLVIIPDLKTLAVSSNGQFYTKQLFGDIYDDILNGMQNNYQASTEFDIQKGDEIQLLYRGKSYNDETIMNVKYLGDTVANKRRALKLEIGYGDIDLTKDKDRLVYVTDSGYHVNYGLKVQVNDSGYNRSYGVLTYSYEIFVPYANYKTELKIIDDNGSKKFFLQGVSFDTIGENIYPKIIQVKSESVRSFILPFFPISFIETGNVQGIINYSKIKGIEKGVKRERTYKTEKYVSSDIDIIVKSKNEVEVIFNSIEKGEIEIEVEHFQTDKKLGRLKASVKQGINSFIIHTENLKKDEDYRVQIAYQTTSRIENSSNRITAKY